MQLVGERLVVVVYDRFFREQHGVLLGLEHQFHVHPHAGAQRAEFLHADGDLYRPGPRLDDGRDAFHVGRKNLVVKRVGDQPRRHVRPELGQVLLRHMDDCNGRLEVDDLKNGRAGAHIVADFHGAQGDGALDGRAHLGVLQLALGCLGG